MSENLEEKLQRWNDLSEDLAANKDILINDFNSESYVEIAEFLSTLDSDKRLSLFLSLKEEISADIFCEFNTTLQNEIYNSVNKSVFAKMFSLCPSESRVDFYKQLEYKEQIKILPFLSKEIKNDVLSLSLYSEETAGGIMSTDFATLFQDMTVEEALLKLKKDAPSQKMLYYAYVVDDNMRMLGFISLPDLILADRNAQILSLVHVNFISSTADQDKETVCSMIEKYSLVAIPILNEEGQLVGIVRYDDAISIIKKEQTEDMEKLMGIVSNDDDSYMQTSATKIFKQRIGWIVGLFFLGILTSLAIGQYESTLAQIPILALFFPMISAIGGNVGSQTAAIIVRELSLNEINVKDFLIVLYKEFKISLLMAISLSFLAFCEVTIISFFKNTNCNHFLPLGVSLALFLQIIFSVLLGTILPITVKSLKGDPAVVASPAIATIVDVTGIVIYFLIFLHLKNFIFN